MTTDVGNVQIMVVHKKERKNASESKKGKTNRIRRKGTFLMLN